VKLKQWLKIERCDYGRPLVRHSPCCWISFVSWWKQQNRTTNPSKILTYRLLEEKAASLREHDTQVLEMLLDDADVELDKEMAVAKPSS